LPLQTFIFSEVSPAAAGTAVSSQVVTGDLAANMPAGVAGLIDDYESIDVIAELKGATGGTLAVWLQTSPDGGLTWFDSIAWPVATAGAATVYYASPLSQATTTTAPSVVGKNLAPALSNASTGSVVNGSFGDRFRLVMQAGTGTSAGVAVVVRVSAQRSRLREAGGA
jgi:hypothetical protein